MKFSHVFSQYLNASKLLLAQTAGVAHEFVMNRLHVGLQTESPGEGLVALAALMGFQVQVHLIDVTLKFICSDESR